MSCQASRRRLHAIEIIWKYYSCRLGALSFTVFFISACGKHSVVVCFLFLLLIHIFLFRSRLLRVRQPLSTNGDAAHNFAHYLLKWRSNVISCCSLAGGSPDREGFSEYVCIDTDKKRDYYTITIASNTSLLFSLLSMFYFVLYSK